MNTSVLPAAMDATQRRNAWFERELGGHSDSRFWQFGDELVAVIETSFRVIETVLGKENVQHHLFALLPDSDGDRTMDKTGRTWEEALESQRPGLPFTFNWRGAEIVQNAAIYGLYGVTPEQVPLDSREVWIRELVEELTAFTRLAKPDPDGQIARIVNLAWSRQAIDMEEGDVDLASLAIFGGITEGRIRNILSGGKSVLVKSGQGVTATSAAAWLKTRTKEFFPSIWRLPDAAPSELPSADFTEEVVFVPVAADDSHFHPGLERNGKFTIGAKGAERAFDSFDEALSELQKMETPRWRRPNAAGNWGIVTGRDWKRIERSRLHAMT